MGLGQTALERVTRGVVRATVKPLMGRPARSPRGQRLVARALFSTTLAPKGIEVSVATGAPVPTERVSPASGGGERTILYLHGGAYVLGSARAYRTITGGLALSARAEVIAPDYRLAPEHSHPAAVEDALATYEWILEQGAEPSALAIAGDSAGGGLTLATALAIRDAELPPPAALYLIAPWVDLTMSSETIRAHRHKDPTMRTEWLNASAVAYAAGTPRDDPAVSPLFADLTELPPTLIHVGGTELLLAEDRELAARLREAGVDAQLTVYEGLWHDFHMHAPLLRRSSEALEAAGTFIRSYA